MTYQAPQEHHRQHEHMYRLGMHGGWTQGATWTKRILIILTAIWLVCIIGGRLFPQLLVFLSNVYMSPQGVVSGKIWQIVTAPWFGSLQLCGMFPIFLSHLFYLFVFGPKVEREFGNKRYIRFFVAVGILSTLAAFLLRLPVPALYTIPASATSAAIFAVMVAYGTHWPRDPFYVMGLFPTPVLYIILILCALEFLWMILGGAGDFAVDYVASAAGVTIGFATMKIPALRSIMLGEKKRSLVSTAGRARKQEYRPEASSKPVSDQHRTNVQPSKSEPPEKKEKTGKRSGFLEL